MNIKFGTDGWRAVIAEEFTFANVARVAQATADYWKATPVSGTEKLVVVGRLYESANTKYPQIEIEEHLQAVVLERPMGQDRPTLH